MVVGGDSDYIAIAQRVRGRGHRIVGIGVRETSNRYWISSCNEFKFYVNLKAKAETATPAPAGTAEATATPRPPSPAAQPVVATVVASAENPGGPKDAHALLRRAMTQLLAQSGGTAVKQAMVKQMMLRLDPAFDEADVGCRTFSEFLAGANGIVGIARGQHDNLISLNGHNGHRSRAETCDPVANRYAEVLDKQTIRLPDPELWDPAMEETFRLLGEGRYLPDTNAYKASLATSLRARG